MAYSPKELNVSHHNPETMLVTIYPCCGNLNKFLNSNPETADRRSQDLEPLMWGGVPWILQPRYASRSFFESPDNKSWHIQARKIARSSTRSRFHLKSIPRDPSM